MSHARLMARGVRAIRFFGKAVKEGATVCRESAAAILSKKKNRLNEAKRKCNREARATRKAARIERNGQKALRKFRRGFR